MKHSKYKIHEDSIEFEFYEFYFSSLHKSPILTLDRIKEVDLNTYPYSIEIDKGEIIFLNHDDKEIIREFIEKNKIPIADKVDVWNVLSSDFLDTEFASEEKQGQIKILQNTGFTENEIKKIRKKINWTFFGTMEWVYLGHWDLLAMKQYRNPFYKFTGKEFYWWTMEIALRGRSFVNSNV